MGSDLIRLIIFFRGRFAHGNFYVAALCRNRERSILTDIRRFRRAFKDVGAFTHVEQKVFALHFAVSVQNYQNEFFAKLVNRIALLVGKL